MHHTNCGPLLVVVLYSNVVQINTTKVQLTFVSGDVLCMGGVVTGQGV